MHGYIRMRIRADAGHLVELAANESKIIHKGLRGRFRELLIENILTPWLPPYATCGTGMIIDAENRSRKSSQEDIIIYDKSIMPNVLASPTAKEGIYPIDGVLSRIEVKSQLTRSELKNAVEAAIEIYEMKFSGPEGPIWPRPASLLFAYNTDISENTNPNQELQRLIEVSKELGVYFDGPCPETPGPIVGLCVVGRGCWVFGSASNKQKREKKTEWYRSKLVEKHEEILFFIGSVSNTCFYCHLAREGRDPNTALDGGIGRYIISFDTYEKVSI